MSEGERSGRGNVLPVSREEADRAVQEAARTVPDAVRATEDLTLVAPDVAAMSPYIPGKPWARLAADLGISETDFLPLNANENVLGPSPRALEAATAALERSHLYPDGGALALKDALARRHETTPDRVVIGNGSNEIIELLVRTFVGPGETIVTAWPSFVVYRLAAQAASRECLIAPLRNDRYDLAALAALVDQRTKLVFISNPNNPTGTYVSHGALSAFLDRIPRSVIVVLDEAYHEYSEAPDYPDGARDFRGRSRLVVLRTFSKAFGLAGLRVGYGIMDANLVHFLDCVRQPYNVNRAAQAAALAALDDATHLDRSRRLAKTGKKDLTKGLESLGLEVIPSETNFLVFRFDRNCDRIVEGLKQRGILVRNMRGYDMPTAVRVTVGTSAMNRRLLDALRELMPGAKGHLD